VTGGCKAKRYTKEEPKKDSEGQRRDKERQESERKRKRGKERGGSLNHLKEKGETDKNALIERQRRQGERTAVMAT
jgi:hypothetical protein